ncbi:MAG: spore protease YyaC [Lachnospiraceae bacterium]|nr:spore protease YyaC [Lachnospiraceae bacterium]
MSEKVPLLNIVPSKSSSLFSSLKRHISRNVSGKHTLRKQGLQNHGATEQKLTADPRRPDAYTALPLDEILLRRYLEECQNGSAAIETAAYGRHRCITAEAVTTEAVTTSVMQKVPLVQSDPDNSPVVILCIGTDRLIGDSLGPLTGSLLTRKSDGTSPARPILSEERECLRSFTDDILNERGSEQFADANPSIIVYGTLENTVHACNLAKILADIQKKHPGSIIIAVDASLSHEYPTGTVLIRPGSLKPGMGVQKDLPSVGDISITGITGTQSSEPYLTLQTTRLSLIMSMAEQICACITSVCR